MNDKALHDALHFREPPRPRPLPLPMPPMLPLRCRRCHEICEGRRCRCERQDFAVVVAFACVCGGLLLLVAVRLLAP